MDTSQARKRVPASALLDPKIVWPAVRAAFTKLHPRHMAKNPVMFVVEVVAALTTLIFVRDLITGGQHLGFAFQIIFWRDGPKREFAFDVRYKPAYDAAVAQPQRPIYLENGQWGPAYMDGYWYATVEDRPISEFVRLAEGAKPPSGAIVLSSNSSCQNCEVIQKSGAYLLYRAK